MRKLIAHFLFLLTFLPCVLHSAPVVPVPGEAGSFLYFPPDISASVNSQKRETIGRIAIFSSIDVPAGWLVCDGSTIQATDYPHLVKYLAGESATEAILPDLRGFFVRGNDAGRSLDPGRIIGSLQEDQILAHTHTGTTAEDGAHDHPGSTSSADGLHRHSTQYAFTGHGAGSGSIASPLRTSGSWASWPGTGTTMTTEPDHVHTLTIGDAGAHTHSVDIGSSGGLEARPRNVSVIYAIRADWK